MTIATTLQKNKIFTDSKNIEPKPLRIRKNYKAGRSFGRIVSPRRGSFQKHNYRFIDYKRSAFSEEYGLILRNVYIPGQSSYGALVCFPNGGFGYIISPAKIQIGDLVRNNTLNPKNYGDSSALRNHNLGSIIHNITSHPKGKGKATRAAGSSTILIRKDHGHCLVKLKSGELRYFISSAIATVGSVGNENHFLRHLGKAGVVRHLGKRPRTRPASMNPVDHPMGGRTRGGAQPMNPKGIITTNRSTKGYYHPAIFLTKRQLKFKTF